MSGTKWFGPVEGYSLLDQMTRMNLSTPFGLCGVCECPLNLMLGPVIRTPLLDRISIQLQFTLGNTLTEILFKVALNTITLTLTLQA